MLTPNLQEIGIENLDFFIDNKAMFYRVLSIEHFLNSTKNLKKTGKVGYLINPGGDLQKSQDLIMPLIA